VLLLSSFYSLTGYSGYFIIYRKFWIYIAALSIGINELIALKAGINEAVKHYNLPHLAAAYANLQLMKPV
jgi:hypothetical protein